MRISDWSSDVCSSDLEPIDCGEIAHQAVAGNARRLDHRGEQVGRSGHGHAVGMRKAFSPDAAPSGQRWVTVLILVQKRTPSVPYWLVSQNALRFQPPKVCKATGTGIGPLLPTQPKFTRCATSRPARSVLGKKATP